MQRREVELFEAPKDLLFSLKDITYTPETPRKKEAFTVKGKVELFGIPFLAPIWVIAKVTYPEEWWEEIIPIIGSPTVGEGQMALGGDFEITFPRGFEREGEFPLDVEAHAGPTYTIDKITLPPFPPMASGKTTFMVGGEVPPEEAGFRNFRILGYGKNGGAPVEPPGVLELDIGDRCRVNVGFDHRNGAVTGKFHAAIWQERIWDPRDEILNAEKTFSVPSSTDWEPWEGYIDIPITSAISPGTEYGLYVKIMGITGGDIFTQYLANVITIVGVPPEEADIKDFDFKLTKGSYAIGAKVSFTAPYDYKGIEQDGQLTISIGTGIYPAFSPVYTYEPIPVDFPAAGDWETRGIEGSITLPEVLEAGQAYSVRAKLETLTVKTQETDTDWSAFDITEVVEMELLEVKIDPSGAGYVTVSPEPSGGTEHNWLFPHGTTVYVTAHPYSGHTFESWSGEMKDTTAITAPVYPMTEKRTITAHFKEEAPPEKVPPEIDTLDAKDITHDSTRLRGELIDTGYWNVVDCYFQWGKTTSYGKTTPKVRLYEGDEGETFYAELLHQLEPDTTYHFRAVAITVGVNGELKGYGSDRSFTTEKEVVKGFTMRVVNARAGSVYWRACCKVGGLPCSNTPRLTEVWEWTKSVPDYTVQFFVWSGDADKKTTQYDEFPFRLRAGKNYVWDFAAHEMREV